MEAIYDYTTINPTNGCDALKARYQEIYGTSLDIVSRYSNRVGEIWSEYNFKYLPSNRYGSIYYSNSLIVSGQLINNRYMDSVLRHTYTNVTYNSANNPTGTVNIFINNADGSEEIVRSTSGTFGLIGYKGYICGCNIQELICENCCVNCCKVSQKLLDAYGNMYA